MKYRNFGLLAAGLAAVLLMAPSPVKATDSASAEIDKRAQDPNQWPAPGRNNQLTRYSPLKDINTENVKKLEMIWSQCRGTRCAARKASPSSSATLAASR